MRFWWASQNQTYRQERRGGFLWSPKQNRNGSFNPYYEFMRELAPGDLVFSFAETFVDYVGIVEDYCLECPRPEEFGAIGQRAWNDIGWKVRVRYFRLTNRVRPRDHMGLIGPTLPDSHSPIRKDGGGNQMYLAAVPDRMAHVLGTLIGSEYTSLIAAAGDMARDELARAISGDADFKDWESHLIEAISADFETPETEKIAVIQARVG